MEVVCLDFTYGKTHDFKQFKDSSLLVLENTKIITDIGYTGILKIDKNSELPKNEVKIKIYIQKKKQMTRKYQKNRIYNEHVIGALKRFRIISEKYRNRLKRFKLRFSLIAGIYNYEFIS